MEFEVNKFIKLKLENNKETVIYVKDERFDQCKFLLLNIKSDEMGSVEDIDSIDEAAERLNSSAEEGSQNFIKIPPEVEFWGHCSVWHEAVWLNAET